MSQRAAGFPANTHKPLIINNVYKHTLLKHLNKLGLECALNPGITATKL